MGVHGLWRLIEPSGKPVPLETLENKVLAVDISIWLHQAVKGFQDSKGSSLPNAHLLGIFHRLCKLLYFRIKPVFVFDGGVPVLKKQTIAKRNHLKSKNLSEANRIQKQLINTLLKHSAVNKVIVENVKTNLENVKKSTNMFELPPSQFEATSSESESESSLDTSQSSTPTKTWDLHTIDEKSSHFKSLPADVRHEILTELKETRKQNSWGRIHELPTKSDDFSGYQMKRLLKRYSIQVSLEKAEKEMGGASLSLGELENLLKDHGVINTKDVGSRIASDENKRYLFIKNAKRALDGNSNINVEKTIEEEDGNSHIVTIGRDEDLQKAICLSLQDVPSTSKSNIDNLENKIIIEEQNSKKKTIAEMEYEEDLEKAIQLSLQGSSATDSSFNNYVDNDVFTSDNNDSSSSSDMENNDKAHKMLASAKNYMTEYSGLTPSEIAKIISSAKLKKQDTNPNNNIINQQTEIKGSDNEMHGKFDNFKKPQLSKLISNIETGEKSDIITLNTSETNDVECVNVVLTKTVEVQKEQLNMEGGSNDANSEADSNNAKLKELVNKISNNEKQEVELISDDTDNDSDFLEVNSKTDMEVNKSTFQIMINKDAKLDGTEDIFSDIFTVNEQKIDENTPECCLKQIENTACNQIQVVKTKNDVSITTGESVDVQVEDNGGKLLSEVLNEANVENVKQLSQGELKRIEVQLDKEKNELLAKQSLKERLATNITEQMTTEAQELLRLFGVPYVIAPMEAEAQCAFLDEINLTDGTITDDSDIWLFGGKTVYKNFFNQSKRVLQYKSESIQHSFKLSRYEMILLALLVGSDYTTGIQGVGPVTALEILAHFPFKKQNDLLQLQYQLVSGLVEFKKWIKGEYNLKGRASLRNKLKNIVLNEQFPSLQVVSAYLEPSVETSNDNFTWGKPDLVSLIDYAKEKFGWNQTKSEEILKPVFKSLDKTNVQNKITNYFKTKHKIEGTQVDERMSKRVKTAVNKIGKTSTSSDEDSTIPKKPKTKRTKATKSSKKKVETPVSQFAPDQTEKASLPMDEDLKILQKTKKVSRKRAKQIENELRYEMEQKELAVANSKISDPKGVLKRKLHSNDVIPQKQRDKADILRTKLKAIETFRKSKQGPGYVKKRSTKPNIQKNDSYLSEDSD